MTENEAASLQSEYAGAWVKWPCAVAGVLLAGAHLVLGDLPWIAFLVPFFAVDAWNDLRTRETVQGWSAAGLIALALAAWLTGGWGQVALSGATCLTGIAFAWGIYRLGAWGDGDIAHVGFAFGTVALLASSDRFTAAYGDEFWVGFVASATVFGLVLMALAGFSLLLMIVCRISLTKKVEQPLVVILSPLCLLTLLVPADLLVQVAI